MIIYRGFRSIIMLHVMLGATSLSWLAAAAVLPQSTADSLCTIKRAQEISGKPVIFFQNAFDRVQDLALGLA